jgi:hypothetical protein
MCDLHKWTTVQEKNFPFFSTRSLFHYQPQKLSEVAALILPPQLQNDFNERTFPPFSSVVPPSIFSFFFFYNYLKRLPQNSNFNEK